MLKQIPNVKFIIAGGDNSIHDGFRHRQGMDYPTYFAQKYPNYRAHVHFAGKVSDDGTDYGFGLGAGFNFGNVQIRGEYELYDTSNVDVSMLSMLSLGVVYQFN